MNIISFARDAKVTTCDWTVFSYPCVMLPIRESFLNAYRPWHTYTAAGIVLAVFCFHAFTLSHGSSWGDDWAMYVNHAYNMVHGRPYAFPGYIFNPLYATYAPTNYPAGYPILLMPVVAIWGLALTPLKMLNLLMFAIALFGLWHWLKTRLHPYAALLLIALVGISPFHWLARDHILSDTPFLTFSVIFFLCYDAFLKKPGWKMAIVLGILMAFIYMLRSAGLFLIATFAIHTVIASPPVRKWGSLALGCSVLLALLHNSLVPSQSYFRMMEISGSKTDPINQFYTGFSPYVASLGEFLLVDYPNIYATLGKIATALMVVCMAAGLAHVRKWTLLETYICVHFAALAFFPGFQGFRYLVGFFPFMLYYGFDFVSRIPVKWVRISVITGMLVILILHINRYYVQNYKRDVPGGIQEAGAQAMFAFIRDSTPADAIIVAEKPRAISLYTDRKGTVYPSGFYTDRWMTWLDECKVTHAVKMSWDKEIGYRYWGNEIDSHPEIFQLLFEKDAYQVWQVNRDSIPVK